MGPVNIIAKPEAPDNTKVLFQEILVTCSEAGEYEESALSLERTEVVP